MKNFNLSRIAIVILIGIVFVSCQSNRGSLNDDKMLFNEEIDLLMEQLTLDEKISLIHGNSHFSIAGVPRLGIPPLTMIDGPNGIKYDYGENWEIPDNVEEQAATYLPVGMTLGATWNPELAYEYSTVLANEALQRKKNVVLGPSINIVRTPLCGRNFEYMSEDPFLISRLAVPYVKGLQDKRVAACTKHYVANNQETLRDSINVDLSERALREIYLPGFKAAVQKGNLYSVMSGYNKVRGEYCSHNAYLLKDVLKKEWGFSGAVISDWAAVKSTEGAVYGGTDIEMGTEISLGKNEYNRFYMADPLKEKIQNNEIDEKLIDDKVRRVLRLIKRTKADSTENGARNTKEHQDIARKVAREGIVLLKNENGFLPIDPNKKQTILIVGENAKRLHGEGGGAAGIKPFYEISPFKGLVEQKGESTKIVYAGAYSSDPDANNEKLAGEALGYAKEADKVIFIGGLNHGDISSNETREFDTEFFDKEDIKLPYNQSSLISRLAEINPNIAVVLVSGAALEMPFVTQVPSILMAFYPGMETGNALAEIIYGKVNPSGKLPVTFPKTLNDIGAHALGEFPGDGVDVHYKDDIYVGYRYLVSNNIKALFPFGHGLSYTTFNYADIKVSQQAGNIQITLNVSNSGNSDGADVVQVYVSDVESSLPRPKYELKGFQKVMVKNGETVPVTIKVNKSDLAFFDDEKMQWVFEPGEFNVMIARSSEDILKTVKLSIN
ncbi:MAG: glycoside hydrolase family 3 C-terminal domain-containing protein [Prolixibacteraceae bacterium]|nr:glycoside hydrolase family 3 C-terminal domain-containing protein [Prolixibacteraceae bacterium]